MIFLVKRAFWLVIAILVICGHNVCAEEKASGIEEKTRKGFIMGFHLGAGGVSTDGTQNPGVLLSLKMGAGVTQKLSLIGDFAIDTAFVDDGKLWLYALSLSPQFFFKERSYFRVGAGYSWFDQKIGSCSLVFGCSGSAVSKDSGKGFSISSALGYEMIRLGKKFALSPEIKVSYSRLSGLDFFSYGGVLEFRWYSVGS